MLTEVDWVDGGSVWSGACSGHAQGMLGACPGHGPRSMLPGACSQEPLSVLKKQYVVKAKNAPMDGSLVFIYPVWV